MPRGDGTGPTGSGPRGRGKGLGRGVGSGRGRMGGYAAGPGGSCVCPSCGKKVEHQRGVPCNTTKCPECGAEMTREV